VAKKSSGTAIVAAIAAAAACAFASPASAAPKALFCPSGSARVFAPWGDYNLYRLAPNGDLEFGSFAWSLSGGASVVSGNEPFYVAGDDDSHSLALPAGSSATSGASCLGLAGLWVRFFAETDPGATSNLRVQVVYRGLVGQVLSILDVKTLPPAGDWGPSPQLLVLGGLTAPLGTSSVQLRFTPVNGTGTWHIDDVYVDPLMQI